MICNHITSLEGSSTAKFLAEYNNLKKTRDNIIPLMIGQPDFQPPEIILQETIKALKEGKTTYTVSRGLPELRESIQDAYLEDYNASVDFQTEILLTAGAKQALFASISAILDPEDSIIISEPRWVSYPDMVRLAHANFTDVSITSDFSLNQTQILEKLTKNTKAILVNSPNNPSGHILAKAEINFLKDLVEDKNIIIISDEIYNDFIFKENSIKTLMTEFKDWRENLIIINGFAKTYSMTGFRLGYSLANPTITSAMLKVIQATTTCPTNFVQWGAIAAIQYRDEMRKMIDKVFLERKNVITSEIEKTPGISLVQPIDGAFYAFMKYDFSQKSSMDIAMEFLHKANVCLIPGTAFGQSAEKFLRATFSRSIPEIKTAFSNIRAYLKEHY